MKLKNQAVANHPPAYMQLSFLSGSASSLFSGLYSGMLEVGNPNPRIRCNLMGLPKTKDEIFQIFFNTQSPSCSGGFPTVDRKTNRRSRSICSRAQRLDGRETAATVWVTALEKN